MQKTDMQTTLHLQINRLRKAAMPVRAPARQALHSLVTFYRNSSNEFQENLLYGVLNLSA